MNFVSVPVYSIGKKLQTSSRAQSPGPGNYNADADNATLVNKGPAWSMGNEKRTNIVSKAISQTGPGSYEAPSSTLSKVFGKMGNDKRKNLASATAVPGPGIYSPERKEISPMGKIGNAKRNDLRPTTLVPGPGNFHSQ
jgi:hypothetical protein